MNIQPLTVMSTGIFLGVKAGRRVRLTSLPSVSRFSKNVGASTSHNPMGFHGFFLYILQVDEYMGDLRCFEG
jgi:hypothetical protein